MKSKAKNINILIVMSALKTGGAERIVTSYANWVVENTKSKVSILLYEKPNCIYDIDERVNVIYPNQYYRNKIKRFIKRKQFIDSVIEKNKIDVIFTVFPRCNLLVSMRKHKNNVSIFSERCNPLVSSGIEKVLSKYAIRKSDGIIFQTGRVQQMYSKKFITKSTVIANPVSNPKVFEVDKNISKEKTITALGRLAYQKGFDVLIDAFTEFHSEYPHYKLMIFGEGELREDLQKQIMNNNMKDYIKLVGTNANAIFEIAKSEIFVLSSRYEGMPNALLEAMAVGTACIATDCVSGPRELIVNNENGILVPVDNKEILCSKMKELIANKNLKVKIEQNAKKILETNSQNTIFSKYYEYMQEVYSKLK